jgi:hypothetical protein
MSDKGRRSVKVTDGAYLLAAVMERQLRSFRAIFKSCLFVILFKRQLLFANVLSRPVACNQWFCTCRPSW